VEHRVAVREGAALDVLAGDADRVAFGEQGGEGEPFAQAPVEVRAGLEGLGLEVELALDLRVRGEVGRHLPEVRGDLAEELGADRGRDEVLVGRAEGADAERRLLALGDLGLDGLEGAALGGLEQHVVLGAELGQFAVGGGACLRQA